MKFKFHVEVSENKVVIFLLVQVYRLPEIYRRTPWGSTGLRMADVDSRMIFTHPSLQTS